MDAQIGNRINSLLQLKKMTQKELALETNLTEAAISRYISGEREPKVFALSSIAQALQVSIDDLLGINNSHSEDNLSIAARNAMNLSGDERKQLIKLLLEV